MDRTHSASSSGNNQDRIALTEAEKTGNVIPAQAGIQGSPFPGSPLSRG